MNDGLILNLGQSFVSKKATNLESRKAKCSIIRDRKLRIKERRKLKKLLQKVETSNSSSTLQTKKEKLKKVVKTKSSQSGQGQADAATVNLVALHKRSNNAHNTKLLHGSDAPATQRHKQGNVKKHSHSLFGGNPEIPTIKSANVNIDSSKPVYSKDSSFSSLDIHPMLKKYILEKMKLDTLTEVQAQAIPVLLSKRDTLVMSETGSGKTITYALAIIQGLQAIDPPITRTDGATALVFVPTRELALQCFDVFQHLTNPMCRIVATCIIGGQKKKSEKARLRKGANIIISTPGRFLDHLEHTTCLQLQNIRYLVFDEADRLLDMGFQKQISRILTAVKEKSSFSRQVILLSATLTPGVEELVELSLHEPVRIEVKPDLKNQKSKPSFIDPLTGLQLEKAKLPNKLNQYVVVVPSKLRLVTLLAFINKCCSDRNPQKLLVFLSCRDSVAFHHDLFSKYEMSDYNPNECSIPSFRLHGGMTQQERTMTMQKFKNIISGVIFCTDVAARGLDIPNIGWVVQYTSPGSPVEYIHRVGRTARAGQEGNTLLFLTPAEVPYTNLLTTFDIAVKELKYESILSDALEYKLKGMQFFVKAQQAKETASKVHKELEECVATDRTLKENAKKAFIAFVRAYATYPAALKSVFHVRNLHLGHVAKSFALQEAPSDVSLGLKRSAAKVFKRAKVSPSSHRKSPFKRSHSVASGRKYDTKTVASNFDLMSEFSSGFEKAKKRKTV